MYNKKYHMIISIRLNRQNQHSVTWKCQQIRYIRNIPLQNKDNSC